MILGHWADREVLTRASTVAAAFGTGLAALREAAVVSLDIAVDRLVRPERDNDWTSATTPEVCGSPFARCNAGGKRGPKKVGEH